MVLGFKKQFVPKIFDGTKIHTIREDKNDRWKAGNKIHFATGVRTKEYNQFSEGICTGVQSIQIQHKKWWAIVYIDGKFFGEIHHNGFDDIYQWTTELEGFAKADGFDSVKELFTWFSEDFSGKIIHWTDKRYNGLAMN